MHDYQPLSAKIRIFTDLIAWQEGHKLVVMVYKATDSFPYKEKDALTKQLRKAVMSITSNIAEGFSKPTYKDKAKFYGIALGSLTEVQNQIIIAKDVGYLNQEKFQKIFDQSVYVHKLLNGLIKKTKHFIPNS